MFKCIDCGHLFDDGEEKRYKAEREEISYGCPMCLGGFIELKRCKTCDEYVKSGEDFCEECKVYFRRHFKNLMSETYTKEERELINLLFEGEEL